MTDTTRQPAAGDRVRCLNDERSCGMLEVGMTYEVDRVVISQGAGHVALTMAPRFVWEATRFEVVS